MKHPEYHRNINPIINRIIAIWRIITCRNYMLIDYKEFEREGRKGRNVRTLYRTDYNKESEILTLKAVLLKKSESEY
jgi:hypothetical protein